MPLGLLLFDITFFGSFADANAPIAGKKRGNAWIPSPKKKRSKMADRDRDNGLFHLISAPPSPVEDQWNSSGVKTIL